jgi:hypothetical protein
MKLLHTIPCIAGLLMSACATAPYAEERTMNLKDAIVSASRDLTHAEQEIRSGGYRTFGLRPSKATVSFDIQASRQEGNSAELTVAPPTLGGSGVFGWSASKQIQKGNHIEIEFTPNK